MTVQFNLLYGPTYRAKRVKDLIDTGLGSFILRPYDGDYISLIRCYTKEPEVLQPELKLKFADLEGGITII